MSTAVLHRSYSQLNQLRTCGEAYRLQRIEHVPSRPSCPAVAGKVIHSATEVVDHMLYEGIWGQRVAGPTADEADAEALKEAGYASATAELVVAIEDESKVFPVDEWKRYGRATTEKPHGEDMDWFARVGIPNAISAYVDWRLAHLQLRLAEIPGFGPAIEVPFNHYVAGQLIHGWIDRVFCDDEGYYPFDLKSGTKPKTDEQLGLYAAALNKALSWDIRYGFYIYAMKSGTCKITPALDLSRYNDDMLTRLYGGATLMIDQGIYLPHPGDSCFHCGTAHACEFAQAAI